MDIVYHNGEFVHKDEARVSIFDRGFLFGDGIYEVVPVFAGKMFGLEQHIVRLRANLEAIRIKVAHSNDDLVKIFTQLLENNQIKNESLNIYLQITRGQQNTRTHAIPEQITPTIVAFCTPSISRPREELAQGFKAITRDDSRRRDCFIKATSLLPNILLYDDAKREGALEAILIRDGKVLEGTSSNVFIVHDNKIMTPCADQSILSGVTRSLILQLANANNIPHVETIIPAELLFNADEIWVTGSSKEICPITQLNDKRVGNGKAGPMWHRIMDIYQNHKDYDGI